MGQRIGSVRRCDGAGQDRLAVETVCGPEDTLTVNELNVHGVVGAHGAFIDGDIIREVAKEDVPQFAQGLALLDNNHRAAHQSAIGSARCTTGRHINSGSTGTDTQVQAK